MALCKLLQHGINADDKRLQDIRVKGEEIHSMEEGIRTRSKSAKSGCAASGAQQGLGPPGVGAAALGSVFLKHTC